MQLKERLTEWTDWDIALVHLAVSLGVLDSQSWPAGTAWPEALKASIWTNNPFCNALTSILSQLIRLGAVEENDNDQVRWNPNYDYKG